MCVKIYNPISSSFKILTRLPYHILPKLLIAKLKKITAPILCRLVIIYLQHFSALVLCKLVTISSVYFFTFLLHFWTYTQYQMSFLKVNSKILSHLDYVK